MKFENEYHGCRIVTTDADRTCEVFRDGESLGKFPDLATAIQAAKHGKTAQTPGKPAKKRGKK